MNKDNPFIEEGLPGDLEGTVCNVMQGLAIFEELFSSKGVEPTEIGYSASRGYLVVLEGMKGALGHVMNELSDYEKKPTPNAAKVAQLPAAD